MSDFTHLHVHSHYSLLDGLGKIRPLLSRAQELGMDSLAITDHGVMYGVIEFIRTAQELGIRPVIGVEAYIAPQGHTMKRGKIDANPRHLTLLAQNLAGYHNLIKLVTTAHLSGYYYRPRIDYDLLAAHSEGLIVLSGCLSSDISRAIIEKRSADVERLIAWHLNVFGRDRFYLEVQHHPTLAEQTLVNTALVALGKRHRLSLAATADSHYLTTEDAEAHDVLLCVQTGKAVQDKDRLSMLGEDFSLKSPAAMKELWKEHPEAIANTQKIAEMCRVELEFGVNRLPRFPLPAGYSAEQLLREKCEKYLPHKYSADKMAEARTRLDYELSVIAKTGFAPYFLIVADLVNEAKRRDILVGPGRGSAAGSIVSYLTGITGLDPLHYNLLFERFLNPDRVSMPDIDLDFADDRRDEVIDYVREKYGAEHVAHIITFGTMAARASVRDAGRALGLPYAFCDMVAKAIPPFMNFAQALAESAELKELYEGDPQARRLIDTARRLEGVCRHASTHAAGVVITEAPLTEHVPLQLSSTSESRARDTVVTQYAMNDVEALGLLKMDFLGLKNLTIIQDTLQRVARGHEPLSLEKLPLADAATYDLLQAGQTTGVFQLESAGMKRWLKELKPTEFEDIISILALYRPGPMDSIPDFVAAKHGRKKITYLHPLLKPILEKTYGVIVTQDQVLQIARQVAGFTYAEADILRKAVGKKIKRLLTEQRDKFIQGAVTAKQIERAQAQKIWDFIEPFARYGFNRAHAACYAMIAYQTAYLKAHWPAEFMAALLTSDEGNVDRQAIEVAEALNLNLKVLPPGINESEYNFSVVYDKERGEMIRFGLGAIKNVGQPVVSALIAERQARGKFADLFDVFRRVASKDFNRKSVESLVKAGAFDQVAERRFVLEHLERLLAFNRSLNKKTDAGQQGLFGSSSVPLPPARIQLEAVAPARKEEKLAWEKELLGLYVSEHPLQELAQSLRKVALPINELTAPAAGSAETSVRIAGVVSRLQKITTKSGQAMLFVLLEDLTSKIEVLVFPSLLKKTLSMWSDGARLLVEGTTSDKDGQLKVLANAVWTLTRETLTELERRLPAPRAADLSSAREVCIRLTSALSKEQLVTLRQTLVAHSNAGAADALPVTIITRSGSRETQVSTPFRLPRHETVRDALVAIVGPTALTLR